MHGSFTISCLFEDWLRRIASCFFFCDKAKRIGMAIGHRYRVRY